MHVACVRGFCNERSSCSRIYSGKAPGDALVCVSACRALEEGEVAFDDPRFPGCARTCDAVLSIDHEIPFLMSEALF